MTPAARIAASIECLDHYLTGQPLERVLTNWARGARYAGSKDRAAIRDIVFQSVRCRDSYAALGGGLTGRALTFGYILCDGGAGIVEGWEERLRELLSGARFSADPVSDIEMKTLQGTVKKEDFSQALDQQDWVCEMLKSALGKDLEAISKLMKTRAPIFVRVNLSRATRDQARGALLRDGIESQPHDLAETALEITSNPRRVVQSAAFQDGWVELQDAASQAVIARLDIPAKARVLDYCAGGGGKALALADRGGVRVFAHDANPDRMRDIPTRAARAGVEIDCLTTIELSSREGFDLVLCDAPCSGSGAWRRAVEGKWALTPARLDELCALQAEILDDAAQLVAPGGVLAYATCSLFEVENDVQVQSFMARHSSFPLLEQTQYTPLHGGDGFFIALFRNTAQIHSN